MKTKLKFTIGIILAVLFAVLIVLVRTVDVAAIGAEDTSVGFASANGAFHELTGESMTLYKVADYLGYAALLLCGFFAVFGVVQLIKRKSFAKVDKTIYALGCLYAVTIAIYVLFDKIAVNYRPIVIPGDEHVEASFPSSHTVLAIVAFGSAILLARYYIKNAALRRASQALCAAALAATVFCRLWSGVHWLTDIIGGALIGASLLFIWSGFFDRTAKADALAEAHRHDR